LNLKGRLGTENRHADLTQGVDVSLLALTKKAFPGDVENQAIAEK
jgi:hypothetical protein